MTKGSPSCSEAGASIISEVNVLFKAKGAGGHRLLSARGASGLRKGLGSGFFAALRPAFSYWNRFALRRKYRLLQICMPVLLGGYALAEDQATTSCS